MIKPQINPFQKYPVLPSTIPNNIHIINSVPANLYFSNIGRYTETGLQGSFLLNHNWPFHMENISQSKILRDSLKLNIYDFNLKKFSIEKELAKNFDEYIEINTLTYFNEYLEQDIAVGLYNKSLNLDLAIQKAPDINLDFMNHKTNYMQKFQHKCLSLDMKTSVNLTEPANKILNNTPKYYKQALQTYLQNFLINTLILMIY